MRQALAPLNAFVIQKYIYFVLVLFTTAIVHGQNQTARVTPTSSIHFYEYLPPDYNSNTDNYPVVFFMHGIGERGNTAADLVNVAKNGPPKLVKNGYKFPFILISPQCKTNLSWPAWYMDEVVEYVKTTLRIDTKRIYIVGLSLGGGGAWTYTQTYPEKVAALAPICGGFNAISQACKIAAANVPVWAFHGDKDSVVPWQRSQNMVNAINACVPTPSPLALMTIYPGVNHNSWDNAFRTDNVLHTPNVYQWLLQYSNGGLTVSAGKDINVNLPVSSTVISGSASIAGGTITSYTWTKVSGPVVVLNNVSTPTLSTTELVEGIYTFRLTATSSSGESAFDDVKVTVLKINVAPVANAGADRNLNLPSNSMSITGSGSDNDGSITSYTWTKVSGPSGTMTGVSTATLGLASLIAGEYIFKLTVTDNNAATHSDEVKVTVIAEVVNKLPVANAGADFTVSLPTTSATVTGSGSDADGTIASYLWEKVSGPLVVLTNASTSILSLSQLVSGTYTLKLTVSDDKGAKGTDQVVVTVVAANKAPVVNAGGDVTLSLPTKITSIKGSASDGDGSIASYAWSQVSGPGTATLTNATSNTVTANDLVQGTYVFRLLATDDKGATAFDDVSVIVNALIENVAPSVNAGLDKIFTLPQNSTTLDGISTDTDGTIASLKWEKISGPEATLVNTTTSTLTVNSLIAGSYVFRLTATDDDAAISTDDVAVTVMPAEVNQAPVANAGEDVGLTLPLNSTTLNGSGTDADGSIASYQWAKTSGPEAVLSGANATLNISGLIAGVYVFTLTVTDNKGSSDSDDVTVNVQASNTPPIANAGLDLSIETVQVTVTGSATDPDGTVEAYLWQQGSGPNTAVLVNDNTSSLTASGLVEGVYTFRFTVTDNKAAKHSDDVKIVVNVINQAPVLSVDDDKIIALPTNTANFTSSAIDSDGEVVKYQWTQTGGPAAILDNAASPTLTVTVITSEIYAFRIEVTDNDGATNFDDVLLTVNAEAANIDPVVSVPENTSITLPLNALTLEGAAADEDGSIASYQWTKISGPAVTITNGAASTVSLNDLVEGTYTFRLMATDNKGATAFAETTLTVLPAYVNQAPTASAGEDQILISPTSSTTLTGTGSDNDGTVVTYKWTQLKGVAANLTNANTPSLTVANLLTGEYIFRLTVTDNDDADGADDIKVTIEPSGTNVKPIASAGPDHTINLPLNIVNLEGSGSDTDGLITRYSWIKVSGPLGTMENSSSPTLTVSELTEGSYVYRLEVEDDKGDINTDDVIVNVLSASVNQLPDVVVDGREIIYLPENATLLTAIASDNDGIINSYKWEKLSGPDAVLLNDETAALTVNELVAGDYQFRVTVTDDKEATASSEFVFTVKDSTSNRPPVADAGEDFTINLPVNETTITGIGLDTESGVLTYSWIKEGGPAVTIAGANTASLSLTGMQEGIYNFSFTVTDNKGEKATDLVTITVLPARINTPPEVNAGDDITLVLPQNSISLTGSSDDDGTIQSILWNKVQGTDANLGGASTNTLMLTELKEGLYTFRYTVTDDGGLSSFDEINITVFPEPAVDPPPVVNAGMDVMVQLPQDSVSINADANSPEGLITSYKWTQVEGEPVTIENDTLSVLDLSGVPPGEYVFRVTVTDALGQQSFDEVHILIVEEQPSVRASNTFSPNGDNIDQTWKIENAFLLNPCQVMIFNRSGLKVYESTGYNDEWEGNFNGKPLDEGVYFYIIRCDNQKSLTGSITLIR